MQSRVQALLRCRPPCVLLSHWAGEIQKGEEKYNKEPEDNPRTNPSFYKFISKLRLDRTAKTILRTTEDRDRQ